MFCNRGILVASIAAALCCGYIAHGQIREKVTDTVKKGTDAAAKTAQSAQKAVDPAKKPADTAKPAAAKPASPAAPAESPDEKAIKATAEAFTKLYNAHDAKGL